jgi:TRAP-type C4-dicarboxylate transport system permease small subunit
MTNTPPSELPASPGLCVQALNGLAWALRASLIVAMAIMLFCLGLQVLMRYVFAQTPSWSEELAILMFAWCALGGLALGVREGFHVRMDLLLDQLSPPARRWAERGIDAVTSALGAYLAVAGWRYVDMTRGATSAAIQYPIECLHALAPVAGVLMAVFALERVWRGAPADAQHEQVAA